MSSSSSPASGELPVELGGRASVSRIAFGLLRASARSRFDLALVSFAVWLSHLLLAFRSWPACRWLASCRGWGFALLTSQTRRTATACANECAGGGETVQLRAAAA